ncbi:uncharacterized protein METZ01_LOCUS181925, partial [marine metagenome]
VQSILCEQLPDGQAIVTDHGRCNIGVVKERVSVYQGPDSLISCLHFCPDTPA